MKDYCTGFPEHWYVWVSLFKWEKVYIGDLCKDHDSECNSMNFAKGMWKRRVLGGGAIVTVASLVCLFRYFKV